MKKGILILILIAAAAAATGAWFAFHSRAGAMAGAHAGKTLYNCAMHPQYISDKPGNCPICGMKLVPMDKNAGKPAGVAAERKIAFYRDPMHPWYTSDKPGKAPDCGMDLVPVYEGSEGANGGTGVRIDPTTVQNMGVKTEAVAKRELRPALRAGGKVKVDEGKLAIVSSRVAGYAERLAVNVTGQKVSKGQTLLEIYSPDLVSAQEEFLQAIRYARQGNAAETGSRELVESSRRRLLNWGVSPGEIEALEKAGHARNALPLVSPVSGVVLEKAAVQGQSVSPGMELYKIADLSKVWVTASVYQRDLAIAKSGAEVELSQLPGKIFKGRVAFVSPVLDEQSRTAEVRIEVANTPDLQFKPEMFATVRIQAAARASVLAVPEQAIIRSGRRDLAVVALGNGYFEPREVKLGASADGYVEILDGLHEGETLVVSSQFLIDSESNLKSAIRQLQSGPTDDGAAMPDSAAMGGR